MDGRKVRHTCIECKVSKGHNAFRRGQIVCRMCEGGREPAVNSILPGTLRRIMKKYGVRTPNWWYEHHGLPNPHRRS